ncbi:MAG: hypothetical protein JW720_12990 [Sedimentisphaerales bacterium]|nr:hypothetical protein [Sedimentisphaerales bacterium]
MDEVGTHGGEDVITDVGRYRDSSMRLTIEQRIAALERDNIVLHDTIKMLHKLLREHRELIKEYVTGQIAADSDGGSGNGVVGREDALYTFVCRQRFKQLSREVNSLRKLIENPRFGSKAG